MLVMYGVGVAMLVVVVLLLPVLVAVALELMATPMKKLDSVVLSGQGN